MAKKEKAVIEIRDKTIDVRKIMRRIQHNIKERKKKLFKFDKIGKESSDSQKYLIKLDLNSVNANFDTENKSYRISSHRKFLGPFLKIGRGLVHGEIKRYVDPVLWKQKEFNASVARILNYFSEEIPITKEQISDYVEMDYIKFENKFRGSEEDIRNKQRRYLRYFKSRVNVLDIGCGRGEFLELLGSVGVKAKGIDIDENMLSYCKSKNLDVEKADAVGYLSKLPDEVLGGIFISQVIEHLKPKEVVEFINLAYKKLKPNRYLVIETVNPTSFVSLSNFFIDLSHRTLLHPQTLQYLLICTGFKEVEVKLLTELPEEHRLRRIDEKKFRRTDRELVKLLNENIDKLNSTIYGSQEYAVICRK
ncbi:MAG: SAM-dependent methyltransferase [Candidatus Fermentimicrarchaeum limneticum]|uniref:SAM-dependent methyltransferase n=1 Tax=Fermentimicrarchaeum limneticum TaxID=2795018 RepID=A0A7D5XIY9_FERL1|nr:MAG: SAM-dependent methyltransferase [Candidatus Fermentimicrarchaeum limneticum]